MPLEAGRQLEPYEIVSSIGAGGMGAVYQGPRHEARPPGTTAREHACPLLCYRRSRKNMNRQPTDILCQKLLESFAELTQVLTSDAGKKTFDIETSAHSAEAFNELRRLHRSLRQYAEKSKALTYVGFVGHFSGREVEHDQLAATLFQCGSRPAHRLAPDGQSEHLDHTQE